MIFQHLRASLILLVIFTLLTGIAYPFFIKECAQTFFPYQANGSLLIINGKIIGSRLIGQGFTNTKYFHSRPSAAGSGYDAANSAGSSLPPSSNSLIKVINDRITENRKDFFNPAAIPVDLVTTSASGLDPEISVASANFQAPRVAKARDISLPEINKIISENTTQRTFNIFGENRVNVLVLNLALDAYQAGHHE